MGDFGIGVGLYFSTLRFLAIVTFIAGCMQIPNIIYFATDYTGAQNTFSAEGFDFNNRMKEWALRGSAICLNTSWEPCPQCSEDDWKVFPSTDDRLAKGVRQIHDEEEALYFIKKNRCEVNDIYAISNIATLLFIVGAVYYWIISQKKRIRVYDGAEYSSADYSIEITVS